MERLEHPDWPSCAQSILHDGKHNPNPRQAAALPFPGYIENTEHPFGYCNALTIEINGKWSNCWSGTDNPVRYRDRVATQGPDWHYKTKTITFNR